MTHLTPLFIMMSLQANELFVVFTVVWCHDIPLVHVQPGAVCACACSVCVCMCARTVCVCVRAGTNVEIYLRSFANKILGIRC